VSTYSVAATTGALTFADSQPAPSSGFAISAFAFQ